MSLTVVIPTHGKRPLLEETLAALKVQDLDSSLWDVVVVDDASPDDTASFLAGAEAAWQGRLRTVRPERNVGRARARNLGAAEARGRWILFLDDDVVAPPTLLGAHYALLEESPEGGVIGLTVTAPRLVDAPHFHYIDTRGVAKVERGPVPARYLVTQNTSLPRAAFEAAGGFDEAFLAYGFEDMDLGYRLEDVGVVFIALPAPAPVHVHHHTFDAWLAKKRECGHGPLQRIAERHPERIRDLSLHWVLDAPGSAPSPALRLLRGLGRRIVRPVLAATMRRWPVAQGARPRAFPMYARLLDLLIMLTYCQGLADSSSSSPQA